jgi:LPS sulfotransferase NodH
MINKWPELFATVRQREKRRARGERASTLYCIAFVARSGSTWLGDVLSRSGLLGLPKEWFNAEAAQKTVRGSGCTNIHQYYDYLKAERTAGGVFGLELTWPQFLILSEESGERHFLDDIPHWFYLRRRDYVAQAVSLFTAINSGIFHSIHRYKSAAEVVYDGQAIDNLVNRIMRQEFGWNQAFLKSDRSPVPLWYEEIVSMSPVELVLDFVERLGIGISQDQRDALEITSAFEKIRRAYSQALCERYREDYAHRIAHWDTVRP